MVNCSHENEQLRLEAVHACGVAITPSLPALGRITRLAAEICRVPAAAIGFVDEKRVWFPSGFQCDPKETGREGSFSDAVIGSSAMQVIRDTQRQKEFAPTLPVIHQSLPRFCAGVPLTTPAGFRIGALSVFDVRPRRGLSQKQEDALRDLASMAVEALQAHVDALRIHDVSARLARIDRCFREFVESAPQGIIGVNRKGAIEMVNGFAEKIFGYEREDLVGQEIEMLLPEAARDVHREEREVHFAHAPHARPMGIGMELRARHRDGTEFPVEVGLAPVEIGGEVMMFSFVTDVTARNELQERLRQAEKLEAVGQLARGVAHDFNNLLTVISGNTHLAMSEIAADSAARQPLEEITEAADRAGALTSQLLTFARRQVTRPQWLELGEHIARTRKILERLIGSGIELNLASGEDTGEILADPTLIDQILINLAVNARDAMPDGGQLTITAEAVELGEEALRFDLTAKPGPHVLLAVTDTGAGMSPETQARLFEPFFTTKGPGKGTGIGLASVYGCVKQMGGGILVSSELGRGTTFQVFLPRIQEPDAVENHASHTPRGCGGETILLVEDDEAVRAFLKHALDKLDCSVLQAGSGEEALRIMEHCGGGVDLILTDVCMPEMSGPALVAELARRGSNPPVLFMSAYIQASSDGSFAFIQKPFSREQLTRKVGDVLKAGTGNRSKSAGQG